MRVLHLKRRFLVTRDLLAPAGTADASALARVLADLMEERLPLVGPGDRSMDLPPCVVGRPVPGTDLVLCYIPAGEDVFAIALVRG